MTVLKNGATSTLSVVDRVKQALPKVLENLPPNLRVLPVCDQSIFVKAAVTGVVREGAIATALASLKILLLLGSWRSTVIIAVSIPLAVLAAIAVLAVFGQTPNVMTLGGLARVERTGTIPVTSHYNIQPTIEIYAGTQGRDLGAVAGIVWMLFITGTTLSVPALTGAIMCMGVATGNAILVIAVAREQFVELGDPRANV